MYTQILKEILLTIDFKQQYFNEFIDLCRNVMTHDKQSAIVQKFEREYRDKTPIRWYTSECFLCPMLNRALRAMDVDIVIKMGLFIGDLHRHIEQLHKEQFGGGHSEKFFHCLSWIRFIQGRF
jgi:hypothetical protein